MGLICIDCIDYQLSPNNVIDLMKYFIFEFQEVDVSINNLYVEYDRKNEVFGKLHECVKALPLILSDLQSLTDVLGNIMS